MKERLIIQKEGKITLPKPFLDKHGLEEGDFQQLEMKDHDDMKLVPIVHLPVSKK